MDIKAIQAALTSFAAASGLFEQIRGAEPKGKPGQGLTAAFWIGPIDPIPEASGLAATTVRLIYTLRVYLPMLVEPVDEIDPTVGAAAGAMFTAISGDFDLGGLIRNVDLLGAFGIPLAAKPGYIMQDSTVFRSMDVIIPMIINDEYPQAA